MNKKYSKQQIEEAISYWENRLNEFTHDGSHIPRHPTRRNQTDKATIYYIAVDEVFKLSNQGGYVMPNGNLTSNTSNAAFSAAAKTKLPSKLKQMVDQAVKKYGKDRYVLVYKEEYSHGMQTGKDHARSGLLLDAWCPKDGGYWYYGYQPINRLSDDQIMLESGQLTDVQSIKVRCLTNPDLNGKYFKIEIENEMRDLDIDIVEPLEWISFLFGHLLSISDEWTDQLENIVLNPKIKRLDVYIGNDLVSIEKNA